MRLFAGILLLVGGTAASAASDSTDFGIRSVVATPSSAAASSNAANWTPLSPKLDLSAAAALGARWGRVTSTYRSPEHNRRVGGVRNSYHIRGRAIDIARRPGVSHGQIAAAYRSAGYVLIESLDEGDHSHFAFGTGRAAAPAPVEARPTEVTAWRIVSAPGALR